MIQTAPFNISKITLLPEDVIGCPFGDVLHVGFSGMTAFAWVKHHPAEDRVMNLATLPTGGPFTMEIAGGFKTPFHVGSFQTNRKIKVNPALDQLSAIAYHVFAWHPLDATYESLVLGRDDRRTAPRGVPTLAVQ